MAVGVEEPVEPEDLEGVGQRLEMGGLGAGRGEEELSRGGGDLRPGAGFPVRIRAAGAGAGAGAGCCGMMMMILG